MTIYTQRTGNKNSDTISSNNIKNIHMETE